ncbi:MAG: hypothetical protein H6739_23390 [Alphaproteobacteria bacterium]|nr:hypothetical protein [Alphaproteobacteria bacterium]
MKVVMMILEAPELIASRGGPAGQAYFDAWKAYGGVVAGKLVGGNVLAGPDQGVTLRVRDGQRQIQDGPYADSKEALGGYMVFEVESMDEALELAAACPAVAEGAVELRPVIAMPGPG